MVSLLYYQTYNKIVEKKATSLLAVTYLFIFLYSFYRLNFKLIVADDTAEAQFNFIGKQAEYLIGSSAQDLLYFSKNQETKKHFPPIFEQLINTEYLFTVQWEKSKFNDDTIYYHVTNIQDVPPTTAKELPAAPATPSEKNR